MIRPLIASLLTLAALPLHGGPLVPAALDVQPSAVDDNTRVLAPASMAFVLPAGSARQTPGVLAINTQSTTPGAVEVVVHHDEGMPWLLPRMAYGEGAGRLLWDLPRADSASTFTLAFRGAAVPESVSAEVLSPASLSERDRLFAEFPAPLFQPLGREARETLQVVLRVPADLSGWVVNQQWQTRIGNRTINSVSALRELENEKDEVHLVFTLAAAGTVEKWDTLALYQGDASIPFATMPLWLGTPRTDVLEFGDRSIESFSVIERNDEIAIYTAVSNAGETRAVPGLPLPTVAVWLSVTDEPGMGWTVQQPVLTSRRDREELLGGPTGLSASTEGNAVFLAFSSAGLDGTEAFYLAHAINSLRVAPLAGNPLTAPVADARLRPAGILRHQNARVLLSTMTGETSRLDVRAGNMLPNWLGLGTVPAPDAEPVTEAFALTGDGRHYLLLSPGARLYTSREPLAGWQRIAADIPTSYSAPQIVRWKGLWLAFGLVEEGGRGVVRWQPINLEEVAE